MYSIWENPLWHAVWFIFRLLNKKRMKQKYGKYTKLSYFFCTISYFFGKVQNMERYRVLFTSKVITCGVFCFFRAFLLQTLCFRRRNRLRIDISNTLLFSTFFADQKVYFYTYLITPLIFYPLFSSILLITFEREITHNIWNIR